LAPTLRRITEMWFFFIFQKLKAPSVSEPHQIMRTALKAPM